MLVENAETASAKSSYCREANEVWKKLWGLVIPNVEKNFLWRACHGILLTRENILKRMVIQDPECLIYGAMVETCFHILWQYSVAADVWGMGPAKFQKSCFDGHSFLEVVEGLFQKCTHEEMNLFCRNRQENLAET
jgi:hypothetical protein